MAVKKSPKKTAAKRPKRKQASQKRVDPSLKIYRRIAGIFVLLVAAVLAVVLFISTVSATITITPNKQLIKSEFLVDVVPSNATEGKVTGKIITQTFEQARTFKSSGTDKKEVVQKAGGKVTLYNDSAAPQPLVATTRLLSSGGVLYRIDEGTVVPAGGSIEVMAHADVEGAQSEIGPETFIIPGLAAGRQKEVYAKSTEPMAGGVVYISIVSEEDLEKAVAELSAEMLEAGKEQLAAEAVGYSSGMFFSEVESKISDTVPGTETDEFNISLILEVGAVFYDERDLFSLAEAKLFEQVDSGFELTGVNTDDLAVEVQNYDAAQELATLKVSLSGSSVISVTHSLLDREKFIGLTRNDLESILLPEESIKSVEVQFFPPWIRRVPKLKDHITIEIVQ